MPLGQASRRQRSELAEFPSAPPFRWRRTIHHVAAARRNRRRPSGRRHHHYHLVIPLLLLHETVRRLSKKRLRTRLVVATAPIIGGFWRIPSLPSMAAEAILAGMSNGTASAAMAHPLPAPRDPKLRRMAN